MTEQALKTIRGITAPEPSYINPLVPIVVIESPSAAAEDSKMIEAMSQSSIGSREVLDNMARLDYNIDVEKGGTLISFHCDYQDYLEENGLIDPE